MKLALVIIGIPLGFIVGVTLFLKMVLDYIDPVGGSDEHRSDD